MQATQTMSNNGNTIVAQSVRYQCPGGGVSQAPAGAATGQTQQAGGAPAPIPPAPESGR